MYEDRKWLRISEAKALTGRSEHAIYKFFDKNKKKPNQNWLNLVTTGMARDKIKAQLRK